MTCTPVEVIHVFVLLTRSSAQLCSHAELSLSQGCLRALKDCLVHSTGVVTQRYLPMNCSRIKLHYLLRQELGRLWNCEYFGIKLKYFEKKYHSCWSLMECRFDFLILILRWLLLWSFGHRPFVTNLIVHPYLFWVRRYLDTFGGQFSAKWCVFLWPGFKCITW